MKRILKKVIIFLTQLWFVTFLIFIIAAFLRSRGYVLPDYLEQYRIWYDNILDTFFSYWFVNLAFGIIFIVVFLWIILRSNKDMGWNDLSQIYSLSRDDLKNLSANFISGRSHMNNVYYGGIHVASIQQGLVLRHPFPFNYLSPALLIPWDGIDKIVVKRGLRRDDQKNILLRTWGKISPWKFADLKLSHFENQTIIIPWKKDLIKSLPKEAEALIQT